MVERFQGGARVYDYIVVGGGDAGATIATGLSENHDIRVLVLEAGSGRHGETEWRYETDPDASICGRRLTWRSGKGARRLLHESAAGRVNLTLLTRAVATRIEIRDGRAVRVHYQHDGSSLVARAEREIVITAGPLRTVQLLQLSGIGRPAMLERLGIQVAIPLPGVGTEITDVPSASLVWSCATLSKAFRWNDAYEVLRTLRPNAGALVSTTLFEGRDAASEWAGSWLVADAMALRPDARACIEIASADPLAAPRIRSGVLDHTTDIAALHSGIDAAREFVTNSELAAYMPTELKPGASVLSRATLTAFLRRSVKSAGRAFGGCAIGYDDAAVVDDRLCVHGVHGLRIADASVAATSPLDTPTAHTAQIAERAARYLTSSILQETEQ